MWQRIQSLYLFLAICLNAFLFSVDLAEIEIDGLWGNATLYGLEAMEGAFIPFSYFSLTALAITSMLVSLVVIFLFKRRQLQIKLLQLNLFLQAALVAALFFVIEAYAEDLAQVGEVTVHFTGSAMVAIIPLVFIYLAIRSIKRDEALIRAADRIR
jgi:hypothetical protein